MFPEKGWRICQTCGKEFHNYNKRRKYCSQRCYGLSQDNLRKLKGMSLLPRKKKREKHGNRCVCVVCDLHFWHPYKTKYCPSHKYEARKAQGGASKRIYISKKIKGTCEQCGKEIESYPSHPKKYCSYQCHLDSGGAYRAGKASGTMMKKYGAKKDANHHAIVDAFKKCGAAVLDLSSLGNGVPDLVVLIRAITYLVDVKNPKTGYGRRGLNANQKEWAKNWKGGPVYLISTEEEVIALCSGKLDGLKRFPPEDLAS